MVRLAKNRGGAITVPTNTDIDTLSVGQYICDGNPQDWINLPDNGSWLNVISVNLYKSESGSFVKNINVSTLNGHQYLRVIGSTDFGKNPLISDWKQII